MGKPYLIMRTRVEKNSEGLGHNAQPYEGDFEWIPRFYDEYHTYTKPAMDPTVWPSEIIVEKLATYFARLQEPSD